MSKIFKRPMFRKGGNVGEGIMTGIVDRGNYEVGGSASERLMKVMQDYPVQTVDPVAQFLIQGGLRGLSQTGGGGTLGNLAKAFEEPTEKLFTNLGAQDKAKRDLALAGEQLDIEQDYAKDIAAIKNQTKDFFASQTPEAQFEVLFKGYNESSIPAIKAGATNLAKFEVAMNQANQPYSQLGFIYDKKSKGYVPGWANIPVGFITYNPQTNLAYKRVDRATNTAADYIPLNPSTLQPLE